MSLRSEVWGLHDSTVYYAQELAYRTNNMVSEYHAEDLEGAAILQIIVAWPVAAFHICQQQVAISRMVTPPASIQC